MKWTHKILCGTLWLLTVCVGIWDFICVGLWWNMRCYLGVEENPYVAEDALVVGMFAVLLTVFPLCLLLGSHVSGIIGLNKRCVKSVMSCRRSEEL